MTGLMNQDRLKRRWDSITIDTLGEGTDSEVKRREKGPTEVKRGTHYSNTGLEDR